MKAGFILQRVSESPLRHVAIFLLAFLPYVSTVGFELVWDDPILLASPVNVSSLADVARLFSSNFPVFQGSTMYRPLVMLSLALDQAVFGGEAWGYHLTNALLHGANAALVAAFALDLFPDHRLALLAGAVFALHPAHPEAVAFVSGRTDLLLTLFTFPALLLFRRGVQQGRKSLLAGAAFFFLLALLSKETGLLLLVALGIGAAQCAPAGKRNAAVKAFLPLLVAAALYLGVRHWVLHVVLGLRNHYERTISFAFLPELAVRYLNFLVLPSQRPSSLHDVPHPFPQPHPTGVRFLLALAVLALVVTALLRLLRRRPETLLPAALLVVPAIPALAFNFYNNPIMIERYLYLPSAGFAILLAWGASDTASLTPTVRRAAVSVVLLVYAALTAWRVPLWRDQTTLFEALRDRYPDSGYVHVALGETYLQRGRVREAADELSRAAKLTLTDARYHYLSGWLNLRTNQYSQALQEFTVMLRLAPDNARALEGIALAHAGAGNYRQALEFLDRAEKVSPGLGGLRHNRDLVMKAARDAQRGGQERDPLAEKGGGR